VSPAREYDLSSVASLAIRETRAARWVAYFFAGLLWVGIGTAATLRFLASPARFPDGPESFGLFVEFVAGGFVCLAVGLYLRRSGPTHLTVSSSGLELSDGLERRFAVKWPSGRWPFTVVDYRQAPVANRDPPGQFSSRFRCIPLTSDALEGILAAARESGLTITDERVDATKTSQDPGVHLYHNIRKPKPL
jgi:hypothetical protein